MKHTKHSGVRNAIGMIELIITIVLLGVGGYFLQDTLLGSEEDSEPAMVLSGDYLDDKERYIYTFREDHTFTSQKKYTMKDAENKNFKKELKNGQWRSVGENTLYLTTDGTQQIECTMKNNAMTIQCTTFQLERDIGFFEKYEGRSFFDKGAWTAALTMASIGVIGLVIILALVGGGLAGQELITMLIAIVIGVPMVTLILRLVLL